MLKLREEDCLLAEDKDEIMKKKETTCHHQSCLPRGVVVIAAKSRDVVRERGCACAMQFTASPHPRVPTRIIEYKVLV